MRTARVWIDRMALRFLAVVAAAAVALPAQYAVTSLADSGNGTLRAALAAIAANSPATATVTLEVSGTCRLTSTALPALPTNTRLTLSAKGFGSGARFTIDATAVTGSPQNGLWLRGADSSVTAPLTLRVNQGTALRISADRIQCSDVAARANNGTGVLVDPTRDVVLGSVTVTAATTGLHLRQVTAARVGGAYVTDCTAQGILVEQGGQNQIGWFGVERCQIGLHALRTNDLTLGSAQATSSALACGNDGVLFEASNRVQLQNARCDDNRAAGVALNGGNTLTVSSVSAARNAVHGVVVRLGASNVKLGPNVVATATAAGRGDGIRIYDAVDLLADACTAGPGNATGIVVSNDAAAAKPTRVTLRNCQLRGNQEGLHALDCRELRVESCTIEDNVGYGVSFVDMPSPWLRDSALRRNATGGTHVLRCPRTIIGPGNRVEECLGGISLFDSPDSAIAGNPLVARCKSTGIQLVRSPRTVVAENVVADTLGLGILVLHGSNDVTVGPSNLVVGTVGTGIKIETSGRARVLRNVVHGCDATGARVSTVGVAFIAGDANAAGTHYARSNLIICTRDIGLLARACDPVRVELCTIVDGGRGVFAAGGSQAWPVRIDLDSTILWNNPLGDWVNQPQTYELISASWCIQQSPLGTGTNRTVDPEFADPAAFDYRLRPSSPAIEAGSSSLSIGAGELDLLGRSRRIGGRVDAGAMEHGAAAQALEFLPASMPAGGGLVDFQLQFGAGQAGKRAVLLCNLSGTGAPWNLFGLQFPLAWDSWTTLTTGLPAPVHQNTIATIAADGSVYGRLDYLGRLPPVGPFTIWAAAVALDLPAARATAVTNVARIDVR